VGAARNLVLAALLVGLFACGGSSPPTGPAADAARVATNQQVSDLAFETFLSELKLDPATSGQIRASRAAVNAKVKPIRLTSFAARQGLQAEPPGIFMVLTYATFLADSLDPMTGGRNAGGQTKPDPLQSTTSGGDTTTTTFLNITMNLQGAGSKVTLTMQWTYKETTTNTKTGEKIVELTDDRTMAGSIDVCPTDGGIVPATIDVHIQLGKSGAGAVASRTSTSSNTFSGHVDDQAVLRRVTHDMQQTASWQNSSGAGGYDFNSTGLNWNAGESGISGGVDASGIGGSARSNGSATDSQVTKEAGGTMAIDKAAVDPAYGAAQKLWRAGRCVVIQAPDYKAETPLATADQGKTQHDEEVDGGSLTKFGINLKHRFAGGALSQPVKASLNGDKKLQPTELKSGSGSLSYTAPGEDDKQATVTLKSVSRRGIGNLVIAFHTKGKHLKLSARGTMTTTFSSFLNLAWSITINPADFHKAGADKWEAQTTAKLTGHYTNLPINCAIQFTETADLTLVATRETRAGQPVWVVQVDPLRSAAHLAGAPCIGGTAATQIPTGGYATMALNAVGDIVIPGDGGTLTLSGTKAVGSATSTARLTFTATVTEE
jgi:hypothetical protein